MPNTYFKYRPIEIEDDGQLSQKSIDFVISPITGSYYYLPTRQKLNDPWEGTFNDQLQRQLSGFLQGVTALGECSQLSSSFYELGRTINNSLDNSGIYSLSKTPLDEVMWAHYSNSNCGLVIEYNLDNLIRFSPKQHLHNFDVKYTGQPPEFGLTTIQENPDRAFRTLLSHKSPRWSYEKEFRILLEGINGRVAHDYRSVESITFGVNLPDEIKIFIYELTRDKVKRYFEIRHVPNSYTYERVELSNYVGCGSFDRQYKLDFKDHLAGIPEPKRTELIELMSQDINSDPHFKELELAEISSNDPEKVVLRYKVQHEMELHCGADTTKHDYPLR